MPQEELDLSSIVVNRDEVVKEGWLTKQSRYLKDWRKRWIVLTETHICSFRTPDTSYQTPTEALLLDDCSTVKSAEEETHSLYAFRVDTPNRCFLLSAASSAEKEAWIGHIGRMMVRPSVIKDYSDDEIYG